MEVDFSSAESMACSALRDLILFHGAWLHIALAAMQHSTPSTYTSRRRYRWRYPGAVA